MAFESFDYYRSKRFTYVKRIKYRKDIRHSGFNIQDLTFRIQHSLDNDGIDGSDGSAETFPPYFS